ncbi:hypothetical protein HanIR_Chr02g0060741 [Helianthus annuus]|nr:hypothetical protein HanIR_Chr02g0060741 [Helianthus annuus]
MHSGSKKINIIQPFECNIKCITEVELYPQGIKIIIKYCSVRYSIKLARLITMLGSYYQPISCSTCT